MSPPIRLRLLRAAQSELVRPVLQVVQHLLGRTGLRAEEGHGDTVTVIQRCGSTANFNFRPALSDDRLQCNAARQVELKLKTPWGDGTTHLVMYPLEPMQRLAALVPRHDRAR